MPLPFLRLPELAQFEVLSNLDLFDIFYFSSISSKSNAIARRSNKTIDFLTWKFPGSGYYIELKEGEHDSHVSVPIWNTASKLGCISLNGEVVSMHRDSTYLFVGKRFLPESEKMRLFEKLNDLIIDTFNVKNYHLEGRIACYKRFVSKYTEKLKILTTSEVNVCEIHRNGVLEEFGVEELRITRTNVYSQVPRLEYSAALKVNSLKCDGLNWLSMEAFWNMDCERITLESACLQNDQVTEMISRWMNGGWGNLKEFTMIPRRSLKRIMKGIEAEIIDEKSFRVRRADGARAIIATKWPGFVITIEK